VPHRQPEKNVEDERRRLRKRPETPDGERGRVQTTELGVQCREVYAGTVQCGRGERPVAVEEDRGVSEKGAGRVGE